MSPIVLDLDGDGIEIVPLNKSSTYFDYNGDGAVGRTAWIGTGDGFLVIDAAALVRPAAITQLLGEPVGSWIAGVAGEVVAGVTDEEGLRALLQLDEPLAAASSAGTPYEVVSASSRSAPNARTCTSVPSARSARTSSVACTPAPP